MQYSRSLLALFAFLATILLATSCVEGAKLPARQTNAERLRRNLAPLAPLKRKPTGALSARQTTTSATVTQGRAAIVLADGTTLGHLSADSPSEIDTDSTTKRSNSFGRRASDSSDVVLKFVEGQVNGSLLAQNALYTPPYIGQSNVTLKGLIPFTNVAEGNLSTIWTLNSSTSGLSAQWTNPDGSLPKTYTLYVKANHTLVFSNKKKVNGTELVTLTLV